MPSEESIESQLAFWQETSSELIYQDQWHTLRRSTRLGPDGEFHERALAEHPPTVFALPITQDGSILLVRQYRHGIDGLTIEPPGGEIECGHTPAETALREITEETGFMPIIDSLSYLGMVYENPAQRRKEVHLFSVLVADSDSVSSPEDGVELVKLSADEANNLSKGMSELADQVEITTLLLIEHWLRRQQP